MSRSKPGRAALQAGFALALALGLAAPRAGAQAAGPYIFTLPGGLTLIAAPAPAAGRVAGSLRLAPVRDLPSGQLPRALDLALETAAPALAAAGTKAEVFAGLTGAGLRFEGPAPGLEATLTALGESLGEAELPAPGPDELAAWKAQQVTERGVPARFASRAAAARAGLWGSAWPIWGPAGAEPEPAALRATAAAAFRPERLHLALAGEVAPGSAPGLVVNAFGKLLKRGEAPAPALPAASPAPVPSEGYAVGLLGPGGEDMPGMAAFDVLAQTLNAEGGRLDQALAREGARRAPDVRVRVLTSAQGGFLVLAAPAAVGASGWALHARAFEQALASLRTAPLTLAEWAAGVEAVSRAVDSESGGLALKAQRLAEASATFGGARQALAYPEIVRQVSRQDVQAVLARADQGAARFEVSP